MFCKNTSILIRLVKAYTARVLRTKLCRVSVVQGASKLGRKCSSSQSTSQGVASRGMAGKSFFDSRHTGCARAATCTSDGVQQCTMPPSGLPTARRLYAALTPAPTPHRNFWPSRLASVAISEAMRSASPALPVRIMGATERGMRPADSARHAAGPAAKAQLEASCRVAETPSAVSSAVVRATGTILQQQQMLACCQIPIVSSEAAPGVCVLRFVAVWSGVVQPCLVKSKPASLKVKWKMPPDQVGLREQGRVWRGVGECVGGVCGGPASHAWDGIAAQRWWSRVLQSTAMPACPPHNACLPAPPPHRVCSSSVLRSAERATTTAQAAATPPCTHGLPAQPTPRRCPRSSPVRQSSGAAEWKKKRGSARHGQGAGWQGEGVGRRQQETAGRVATAGASRVQQTGRQAVGRTAWPE